MKMKVTLDKDEIIKILDDAVSKQVGQPMTVRNTYEVNGGIEFEQEDILEPRVTRPVTVDAEDRPVLSTPISEAAQDVEEEVSL